MQVDLVDATREDLPSLFHWMRQLRTVDPMSSESVVPTSAPRTAMEQLISDPSAGRVWIIRADGHSIGYVILVFSFSVEFGGRTAFVDELYIDERWRGRGVGKLVLEQITDRARQLRVQNLLLEVTESNTPARRLYERAGFADRPYRLMTRWIGKEEP